jgi:D-serine deaminase-like pyridoxal phosphate-dependent protein
VTLSVGIDSVEGAQRLARAVEGSDRPLSVVVEVDSGGRRTGVAAPAEVVRVAAAARSAGLHVAGAFTHGGHSYRDPDARIPAAADEVAALGAAADALRDAGHEVERVSAGSTPTGVLAAAGQVGTYLLGDRLQLVLGAIPPDGVALVVAATVVSTAVPGQVVVDAGAKSLTKDRAPFLEGFGLMPAYPDAVIGRLFDYHGAVAIPPGTAAPSLGELVAIVPNHVCPVVDLFDTFIATRSGVVVGRWPVDARGRSG